ncbi:MAG: hypothetical protein ACXVW0_06245 [Nocardioides sp.]
MSPTAGPAVVRNRLLVRIGWVPLFLIGIASWVGLATSARDGFPGLGRDAVVVLPLAVAIASAFTLGGVAVWRFRQVVSADALESRGLLRTERISAASAVSVAAVPGAVRGLRRRPRFGGFLVTDGAAPRRTVVVSSADAGAGEAFDRLREWVRLRPELVARDSWACELLAGDAAERDRPAGA